MMANCLFVFTEMKSIRNSAQKLLQKWPCILKHSLWIPGKTGHLIGVIQYLSIIILIGSKPLLLIPFWGYEVTISGKTFFRIEDDICGDMLSYLHFVVIFTHRVVDKYCGKV